MKAFIKGILALALSFGVGYIGLMALTEEQDQSYPLTYGTIDKIFEARGYIIRNEVLLTTESEGQVRYLAAEGQKVRKNESVAQIVIGVDQGLSRDEETPPRTPEGVQVDLEKIDYEINYLHAKILNDLSRGSYREINLLKEALNLALSKRQRYSELLEKNRGPQVNEIQGNEVSELRAPVSGVVTYYFDGYEDVFRTPDLFRIDFEKLVSETITVKNRSTQVARVGDLIYKVVDSNALSLLAILPKEAMDYLQIGAAMTLEFEFDAITGSIVELYYQEDYIGVLFDTDQIISDFQKIRQVDVTLHPTNFKGLKVENSSLVKQDGHFGVYVMNVQNKPVWTRVKILGYDADHAIVAKDSFILNEGDQEMRIPTVGLHDEVLRNGAKYAE